MPPFFYSVTKLTIQYIHALIVDALLKKIRFKSNNFLYEPKLIRADSTNLKSIIPDNSIDFILAHPPYANIIKYSKDIKQKVSNTISPSFVYFKIKFLGTCGEQFPR